VRNDCARLVSCTFCVWRLGGKSSDTSGARVCSSPLSGCLVAWLRREHTIRDENGRLSQPPHYSPVSRS
jgi:hypothetical protein